MTANITANFNRQTLRVLTLACLTILITACKVVGPNYERPSMDVPATYKEATALKNAKTPTKAIGENWWALYDDSELDKLIAQVEIQNYSLQAVDARVRQAQALTDAANAANGPTIVAGGKNDLGIVANWEIDLWGRIRRNIESSGAAAQASVADRAALKLSLQAQLAQNYFLLRVQDAEIRLLQDTAVSYEQSLKITRNQYAVGVADRGSVMQAQTQLSVAQAQAHNARVARAQLEHAIAVLIGKAPADFTFVVTPVSAQVPDVPPALPAELLQRRPDIAAAERRMAAASAQIGVAEAAAYPTLGLFAGVTIRKGIVGGAQMAAPLYPKETPKAVRSKAVAAYEETVADYRQTVLNGFREVEDSLATQKILEEAASAQDEAVKAGRQAIVIAKNQYGVGITSYQALIIMQAAALDNERAALTILSRRLVASVALIKALGGGWDDKALTAMQAKVIPAPY
ncbi:MAG: efflux transporter outer membrane subunit [Methylotenera sp.]|nr:efflux transporter outer membrane subunit [Methylotenera sp.]